MWETLLDALIDTLKLAPIIVATYILIELVESKFATRVTKSRALFSHAAPALGAAVGIVPQCGFSVVSANLYSARKISLGTLLAVFIATSDEAVPVLLADYTNAYKLLPLLVVKFVLALVVGYAVHFLCPHGFKFGKTAAPATGTSAVSADKPSETAEIPAETHDHDEHEHIDRDEHDRDDNAVHGCHGHNVPLLPYHPHRPGGAAPAAQRVGAPFGGGERGAGLDYLFRRRGQTYRVFE